MVCTEAERLSSLLKRKKLTLSIAESCTGGMISSRITDIPGSSEFFIGSAVTYSDTSKMKILNVREKTIKEHGAVSAETADEMSAGAAEVFHSDVSASVTGFAGPSGGSDMNPVGLVFISVRYGNILRTTENLFKGSRIDIKNAASDAVISEIIRAVGE